MRASAPPPAESGAVHCPPRLLVRWRALWELESHADLVRRVAEILGAEVLVLSPKPIPRFEKVAGIRVTLHSERFRWHPALVGLSGWRRSAEDFRPDLVLALDEAYCRSTWQLVRWAANRGIPSAYLSCQNIDRPLPWPFRLLESKTAGRAAAAWFLNEEARDRAQRRGFRGVGEVIPLAVNPEDFPLLGSDSTAPSLHPGHGEGEKPFTVGYAGRLVPEKGVETLLAACSRVGARLLVAGEGPERGRLEHEADALGVEVEWLGAIPSDRMGTVYSRMDALVLPSLETPRWKEQFGRVLIEAMAAGVPVVGSDSGEIPRVIDRAGLVFPTGDAEALAACLMRLRGESGLRERSIENGLARVRQHFTNPIVAERIAGWIRGIVGKDPVDVSRASPPGRRCGPDKAIEMD